MVPTPVSGRRTAASILILASGALACVGSINPDPAGGGTDPGPGMGPGGGGNPGPGMGPGGGGPAPGPGGPGTPPGMGPGGGPGPGPMQPPGAGTPPDTAGCGFVPRRIWPLTPNQYLRTITSLLPALPTAAAAEDLNGTLPARTGFSNEAGRLDFTDVHVGELMKAVLELAGAAAADPAKLAPCLGGAAAATDAACHRTFVSGFGTRAFRRDLTAAEIDEYTAYLKKEIGASDLRTGLRRTLMFLFTSPSFLFRTELGADGAAPGANRTIALTPAERASALSYFLTDGPPDAELFAAARSGALADKMQIEAHTRRLLARPEAAAGVFQLFAELFDASALRDLAKDPMAFPDWKPPLLAELAKEGQAFVRQVLWSEDAKLGTLLSADFSMLNGALATFYGAPAGAVPAGNGELRKVTVKPGQRAGLLTQAGMMAVLAKDNDTDPVARGRFVREVLLCQHLPPPPDTVNAVPPPPDGKRTQRERLSAHSLDPTCAVCHALMDPLGLAFETFDGIGRARTTDVGKTIDASGKLTRAEPDGAPFANGVELMKLLARSPDVARCFVETAFRYAHGRDAAAAGVDRCALERMATRFSGSGGNIFDLAVAITTDDTFFTRVAGNP